MRRPVVVAAAGGGCGGRVWRRRPAAELAAGGGGDGRQWGPRPALRAAAGGGGGGQRRGRCLAARAVSIGGRGGRRRRCHLYLGLLQKAVFINILWNEHLGPTHIVSFWCTLRVKSTKPHQQNVREKYLASLP